MKQQNQLLLAVLFLLAGLLQAEEYTVVKGDNLYSIARRFGTTVAELKKLNNLSTNKLSIGQILTITPAEKETETTYQAGSQYQAETVYHRVRPGETLSAIARRYQMSVAQLQKFNNINGSLIKPGQRLLISKSWSRQPQPNEPVLEVAEATPSETEMKMLSSLPPENKISQVVEHAMAFLGTPYRLGGTNDRGIDCSGLVKRVFANVGVKLPRTAREQYQQGEAVPLTKLSAGDLLFFSSLKSLRPTHVALYLGNGLIIHASREARKVVIGSFDRSGYLKNRFVGARRIIGSEEAETTAVP
ncbi:MAG: LysM peptidoglycan-binding domain-containing protein [Candidatus Omnitrophica bacterium]|nr:LysM peptidoglycan-binding domain-containing protein [Candidatus Omnitrophota bacterium]